jgi:hypothetical protein
MSKKGLKIVTIGGGSSYTPELVEGLIKRYNELPVAEYWLVDIEEGKEKCDNQNCEICTTTNSNFYNNVTNVSSSIICENSGKTSKTEVVNANLTSASFTQNQGFFIYKNSNVIESVVNCSGCMTVDLVDLAGTTCNLYLSKIETSVIIDAEVNTGINYILKNTDTISFAKIFRNEETINFTYEESE